MSDGTASQEKKGNSPGILVLVLLGFAVVLGGFGGFKYKIGKESTSWPTVSGKVTYSHAETTRKDKRNQYRPAVKYSYTVDGRGYVGARITASDQIQKNISSAKDILRKYPVGAQVVVHYDPGDPGRAVLVPGLPGNVYVMLAAAAACIVLAVLVGVSALRRRFQSA